MPEFLLALRRVSCFRGERPVLRDISLEIHAGETILVLGSNGAGKSTLLRIMAGLGKAGGGEIQKKDNLRLAYIGHPTFLYPGLTAMQNLAFQAKINGRKAREPQLLALLESVGLGPHTHEPARIFSRGMAQRLNFCRALLLEPELFLLDEPFTGMDAASQKMMRSELAARCKNGAGIALVSHAPREDAPLADQIFTLARGRLNAGVFLEAGPQC